jgi:IS30 family transposase
MFSERMNTEVVQQFWAAMQQSVLITEAAEQVGTYREMGTRWLAATGGIRPRRGRNLKGRCLSFREREEIALSRSAGESMRSIAAWMGRSPSTISRELARNSGRDGRYQASSAHALAYQRASRPKPSRLLANPMLRQRIEQDLTKRYSPEQIVGRLRLEFPDDPTMHIAVETIYRSLYLPSCGGLRRELTRCLRTGRQLRRPRRKAGQRKNRILDMVSIRQRPAEASDRDVPGHWEGDLIVGRNNRTTIGTLVERSTG